MNLGISLPNTPNPVSRFHSSELGSSCRRGRASRSAAISFGGSASAKAGLPDAVALWSGQGAGLVRAETTSQVIARLVAETEAALARV